MHIIIFMKNQILETRKKDKRKVKIFKGQLFVSLIGIIATIAFLKHFQKGHLLYENYSKTLSQTSILSSVYEVAETSNSNILGTLEIPSLDINYAVFNEYSEELLKMSPCKFYGVELRSNSETLQSQGIILTTTPFLVT